MALRRKRSNTIYALVEPKRKQHAYWGMVDVAVLPTAPHRQEGCDGAIVPMIFPLWFAPRDGAPSYEQREDAIAYLKDTLPPLGYELRYLDEFRAAAAMAWENEADTRLYHSLVERALETGLPQFGHFYFYPS